MRVEPATRRRIGVNRKALMAAALATVAALSAAGCAAGRQAATAHESPAIDGTGGIIGAIELRAVAIAAPKGGPSYSAGDTAPLMLIIVNDSTSDDALVGAAGSGGTTVQLYASASDAASASSASATATSSPPGSPTSGATPTGGSSTVSASALPSSSAAQPLTSLAIPAGERVSIGVHDADHALVVTGLTKPLFPGMTVSITFTFRTAGSITLSVPVQLTTAGAESPLIVPPGTAAP